MSCTSPATASCRTGSGTSPSRTSAGGKTRTMAVRWRSGCSRAAACAWSSSAVASRPGRARRASASASPWRGTCRWRSAGGPASPTTAPPTSRAPSTMTWPRGSRWIAPWPRPGASCSKRVVFGSTGPSGSMRALRYRSSTPPKPPTSWWMNTARPYGRNGPVSVTNCSATTSAACGKASWAGGACYSARTLRYRLVRRPCCS